ncbi:phospholipase D family protein [Paracoccus sp. Z330]|uniref:Phospholipase D n=1 Tax=Paracoccus onchidii TaxID=3017813 RepID=A0ABT4ZD21_9RHOB|nr:phospholipase D family protein [Paracoccus onchidii]MDB6177266.1 phospholipase D family protein [Paracoccus onchidii]
MKAMACTGILLAMLVTACARPVVVGDKVTTTAFTDTSATFLARKVDSLSPPRDGRSGVRLVPSGPEALAMRQVLSEQAERSIDAQYYLLHDDVTGHIFAGELLLAADRGVRVRLLLDDMYTSEYDPMTIALTRHPNINVRLFNPFRRHVPRAVNSLFEFSRIDRRMHNKSMTFDNQVTIVGGRNIGDEYFSARNDSNYDDLDMLAVGPVVEQVSGIFDDYWNSPHAIPAQSIIRPGPDAPSYDQARARLIARYDSANQTAYASAVTHDVRAQLRAGDLGLTWAPAQVLADPPHKAAGPSDLVLASYIAPLLRSAQRELIVESAYFMPGERGTALLKGIAQSGVRVVILTNSLESNDVGMVHGHYARYRKELLQAGVELWELRPDKERPDRSLLKLGQSLSGLHAKAFSIDGKKLFVGSFNWDPRSIDINTEMGILVGSPELTETASRQFLQSLPDAAYKLRLNDRGQIEWLERQDDGRWTGYGQEPAKSGWQRFITGFYGYLPVGKEL